MPFIIIAICLGSFNIYAQNVIFGVQGNFGNSWNTQMTLTQEMRAISVSAGFGIFARRNISEHSRVQLELSWVGMTAKRKNENIPLVDANGVVYGMLDTTNTLMTHYLCLPLLYGFQTGKFQIRMGPQVSVNLRSKSRYESEVFINLVPSDSRSVLTDNTTRAVDFGLLSTIEYELWNKLGLMLNYYHGITNVSKSVLVFERRQRRFSIGLNYLISN